MYIAPNSTIKLLSGVPLINTYEDTLYFANASDQLSYFNSTVRFTFDDQMYQRYAKHKLRIRKPAEQIYGCNYLMFQNTAFDTKWFYAFINKIEYINNEVTEIEYEIDVIQTYMFNYDFGNCFIQRCHTVSDQLFEHTIEEPLPLGDGHIATGSVDGVLDTFDMNTMKIIVMFSVGADGTKQTPHMINNVLVPFGAQAFSTDSDPQASGGLADLKDFIDAYIDAGREDAIVAIFMCPSACWNGSGITTSNKDINYHTGEINYRSTPYTPKNKKCFNYPYYRLCSFNDISSP